MDIVTRSKDVAGHGHGDHPHGFGWRAGPRAPPLWTRCRVCYMRGRGPSTSPRTARPLFPDTGVDWQLAHAALPYAVVTREGAVLEVRAMAVG